MSTLLLVVLDACVLVPGSLRDTLLRAAEAGLYRLCWSDRILDELRLSLVQKLGRNDPMPVRGRRLATWMPSGTGSTARERFKSGFG